ncbi:hypothetical protein [Clostridium chauvoei]|nr:hypothetical protein [Clostridium chauvoei]
MGDIVKELTSLERAKDIFEDKYKRKVSKQELEDLKVFINGNRKNLIIDNSTK